MYRVPCPSRRRHSALVAAVLTGGLLAACANMPGKDDQEAAKNTFACQLSGERLVIRFDAGEARLLMPDAERIVLYQIPVASGVRYSNGILELRGKGMELQLIRNGIAAQLADCAPYTIPK
jgi:membrane-bound inhibitor of C-type lysozyme